MNSVITCDRVAALKVSSFPDDSLSMYQVSLNSLPYFQGYAPDKLFTAKIKKKRHSVNIGDRVTCFAFSTFIASPLFM